MRGRQDAQNQMFFTINLEEKVPADHPLRDIKRRCDRILAEMNADFSRAYSKRGRRSIPPEQLIKALMLRCLYSIPSEIRLMEAIDFNLLYRWFLGLSPDDKVWTPETFSMNRERFEKHRLVARFFDRVVQEGYDLELSSSDHFTVDGTLIRSWASMKSLKKKDKPDEDRDDDDRGNPTVNWHGEKRGNQTHESTTDPEARLFRKGKGKEALLSHSAHFLMENRNGLIVDTMMDAADGKAERRTTLVMLTRQRTKSRKPRTLGADKNYDAGPFLANLENRRGIIPHVASKAGVIKAQDAAGQARTRNRARKRNKGYQTSQRIRKRVEELIGWVKKVATLEKARHVGRWKIQQEMHLAGACWNLLRMRNLEAI